MLEAIYSCKMYRFSKRKDKINAALNDPINTELVGQLSKALDDEYQKPEYLNKNYTEDDTKNIDSVKDGDIEDDSSELDETKDTSVEVSEPIDKSSSNPLDKTEVKPTEDNQIEEVKTEEAKPGSSQESDVSDHTVSESTTSSSVAESIQTSGLSIFGSRAREKFKNMKQVSDEIKGLLNFKDTTIGVNRILSKENELWIYYNDDVNLNNVMGDVIETLNASGYSYLEFNRLARSDNAIVFQIIFKDTNNMMKSMNQIQE